MKVVIDTNIWISYLLGNLLNEIDELIISKKLKIIISEEMLKELSEVLQRPKFKSIFTYEKIKELFALLENYAMVVYPSKKVSACRDPKDNFLLEAAIAGGAEYIITGDNDLLVLDPFNDIKILNPKDFKDLLPKHTK